MGLLGVLTAVFSSELNDQVTNLALADVRGGLGLDQDPALARARADVSTTLVDLYKALGGGWRPAEIADVLP